MKKLKCPFCEKPYTRWKLIYPRWYEVCPNCKSKLVITTRSALLSSLIWGFIFAVAMIIFGKGKIFSMPFFIYFIVPFLLIGKVLVMALAEFEKLPDKHGLLPMTRSSKYALLFIILGTVICIVLYILVTAYCVYYR